MSKSGFFEKSPDQLPDYVQPLESWIWFIPKCNPKILSQTIASGGDEKDSCLYKLLFKILYVE